jgi:hypothetical protein
MTIFFRLFSKKIREIEVALLENIKDLECSILNDFKQNLLYLDPDRNFNSVLSEIESLKFFKCICLKKMEDSLLISSSSENSPKNITSFINSMSKYPFLQITSNKDSILVKKLR